MSLFIKVSLFKEKAELDVISGTLAVVLYTVPTPPKMDIDFNLGLDSLE